MAGVWVGNDDDRGMARIEGGGLPARIFRAYLAAVDHGLRRPHRRPLRLARSG